MTARRAGRYPRTCPVLVAIFLLGLSVQLVRTAPEYDPYKILGVSRSASQTEIKRAYKNLAKEWWVHPARHIFTPPCSDISVYLTPDPGVCDLLTENLIKPLNLVWASSGLWCPLWDFCRHPDKNKDPKAEDMFIKVSKSYEVGANHNISYTVFHTSSSWHLSVTDSVCVSLSLFHFLYHDLSQILSNEERRSNFDRYGQMDENQPFGQSQHHGFRGFHNSFYFDESFFHFPRYFMSTFVLCSVVGVSLSNSKFLHAIDQNPIS